MPFNFPDPAVSTTATNPVTGATYQWKADPGKWVLTGGAPPAPDTYFPFTSSYTLVHPDNYTEADGTCTAETAAYASDPDANFLSPTVKIWRFAPKDLNGQPLLNGTPQIKYFDYVQYPRSPRTGAGTFYGTFQTTGRVGFQDFEGETAFGNYLNLTENAEVHIRYPSEAPEANPTVYVSDTPPDDPVSEGELWWDSSDEELTLYIRYGSAWIPAAPPVSLDGINATIDAALVVQSELLERVTNGEETQAQITTTVSDALAVQNDLLDEQEVQNSQINALETQVQLLAGVKAVGTWTYRRRIEINGLRPPAIATFYGTDVDDPINNVLNDWSKLQLIMVDKTDIDGTTYTFSDFQEGDKLEILATDGSSACFGTVTNNPNVDGYGNLIIAVERSNGGPVEEATYLLSVYRPGSSNGNVDLDILDGRYLVKTGDTMTGTLALEQSAFSLKKADGTQIFEIKPNESNSLTNIYAYNTAENDGGVLFRVAPGDTTDGYKTFLQSSFKDNIVGTTTHPVTTEINWLKIPTLPHQAANKHYVDEIAASPARLQWQYNGSVDSSNDPGSGNMVWHTRGYDGAIGYLRLSFVTLNGLTDLGYEKFDDTIVTMDYGPVGTVWQWQSDVGKWKLMLQFRVKTFRWNYNNHFELGVSSQNGRRFEDIANAPYFVTVGGFF